MLTTEAAGLTGRFTGAIVAAAPRRVPPGAPRRVLVVEDHPAVGESMARLLMTGGHQVRLAATGPLALRVAIEFSPEVVLLDLGLPGMDGMEVARRLRRNPTTRRSALVALTGWAGDDERRRSIEAGCDFHLVKPVDVEVIESLIESLVADQTV